jgi:hypothetical protein
MKGGIFNARKESTCQEGTGQKARRQKSACEKGRACQEGSCEETRQEKISG